MDRYKHLFDLHGKSVALVGATGLIGTAFAEGLAEYGATIALMDINQGRCDELAKRLKQEYEAQAIGIETNIAKRGSVENALARILAAFGKVDVLVNSAQNKTANFFASFEEYTDNDWNQIIDVNLNGVFLTCQVFGKQMLKQGKGNIINLASTYAIVAPNQKLYEGVKFGSPAAYSASKGGVVAFSNYLASYWANRNIRVNMITPHGVYNNHHERFVSNFSQMSPVGRMSQKDEVVGGLIYLASDASTYVTGHNLIIDGGWSVW